MCHTYVAGGGSLREYPARGKETCCRVRYG